MYGCVKCNWQGRKTIPNEDLRCPICPVDGKSGLRQRTKTYVDDHLFLLTKRGMMARYRAFKIAERKGRSTGGTMVMELRDEGNKKKYIDEIIFTARLPGHLVEGNPEIPDELELIDDEEE